MRYLNQNLKAVLTVFVGSAFAYTPNVFSASYPANIDYGTQGDFVAKVGTEYGRTANLTLVGPLLVNLPEAPGSTSDGIPYESKSSVWELTDLTQPSLIRTITCDTCFMGMPISAHATITRFDNDEAYLYMRERDIVGNGEYMTFDPLGLTSNDQAASRDLNWGFDPMSYPMMFSPYYLREWWEYGNQPSGLQSIRDPSNLLPIGESQHWLGEHLVQWDHLGLTGVTGFAAWLGNLLVVSSDQQSTGMAIYDISGFKNGDLPRLLSTFQPTLTEPDGNQLGIGGYWMEPYGTTKMVWAARTRNAVPIRNFPALFIVDFENPTQPRLSCELYFDQDPNDPSDGDSSSDPMYVNFQDQYAYVDHFKVDINACENAYSDGVISDQEFSQIVYRFNDIENSCDGSQYFRPLGQVGVFGGYDWWETEAIISYSGVQLPLGQYLQNQNGLGFRMVYQPATGEVVVNTNALNIGDTISFNGQSATVTDVQITPEINEQGMCFMVTSDEPDTNAPFVSGHRPLADQTNYPVDGFIHIHIPETLRTETVINAITVTDVDSGQDIDFRYQLAHTGTISIWPSSDLAIDTTYEVNVTGIQDFMGNTMTPYQFRFSTGVSLIGNPVPPPGGGGGSSTAPPSFSGTAFYPNQSSQMSCEAEVENGHVWAVNPDNDSVTIVDRSLDSNFDLTINVLREIKLNYEHPTSVTKVGNLFAVTYQDDDKIVFFDAQGNPIRSIDSGHGTQPIASVSVNNDLYIALYGSGEVIKVNASTGEIESRLAVGPKPKAMAIHQTRLLVTRFISDSSVNNEHGAVYDIDISNDLSLTRTIQVNKVLVSDDIDHGSGLPNYLSSIVISPDGNQAYITAVKANIDNGLFKSGQQIDDDNSIRPMIITLDLINHIDANIDPTTRAGSIDLDNAADPSAITFLPDGVNRVYTLQGNNLAVSDNLDANTTVQMATGFAPQSMCTTLRTLYVKNFTDRSISAIDIAGLMHDSAQNPTINTLSTVSTETLSDEELEGLKLFYEARSPDLSPEGYISCASCHIGGGHDGLTWDMTQMGEGLRNTLSLNGSSGVRFGDLHWSQNFDEVQDFEIQIERLNGATGLIPGVTFPDGASPLVINTSGLSTDLDALATYVNSLGKERVKHSPHRSYTGDLTAAAQRGQQVFTEKNCQSCHAGAAFRDGQGHAVGTIKAESGNRLGLVGGLSNIRTPTLIELWDSAPYFHDGSAATLSDVFQVGTHVTDFTGTEQDDLIQYLLSIDRSVYIEDNATFPDF